MTEVELHPAIFINCDACGYEGWNPCIVRTGLEAAAHVMKGGMDEAIREDKKIRKIINNCRRKNIACPNLPDLRTAFVIQEIISCRKCKSTETLVERGFKFICEECGRDNYIFDEPTRTVSCGHCKQKLKLTDIS